MIDNLLFNLNKKMESWQPWAWFLSVKLLLTTSPHAATWLNRIARIFTGHVFEQVRRTTSSRRTYRNPQGMTAGEGRVGSRPAVSDSVHNCPRSHHVGGVRVVRAPASGASRDAWKTLTGAQARLRHGPLESRSKVVGTVCLLTVAGGACQTPICQTCALTPWRASATAGPARVPGKAWAIHRPEGLHRDE